MDTSLDTFKTLAPVQRAGDTSSQRSSHFTPITTGGVSLTPVDEDFTEGYSGGRPSVRDTLWESSSSTNTEQIRVVIRFLRFSHSYHRQTNRRHRVRES